MHGPKLPTITAADRAIAETAFGAGDAAAAQLLYKHGRGHRSGTLRCRCERCTVARYHAYRALKNRRLWPLLKIAAAFGKSDHHQILTGIQKAEEIFTSSTGAQHA